MSSKTADDRDRPFLFEQGPLPGMQTRSVADCEGYRQRKPGVMRSLKQAFDSARVEGAMVRCMARHRNWAALFAFLIPGMRQHFSIPCLHAERGAAQHRPSQGMGRTHQARADVRPLV